MPVLKPQHQLVLSRHVPFPPLRVYAAWTDPSVMTHWLGNISVDVQVGGNYRYETQVENATHTYTGQYVVLEPERRIVQTFLAGVPDPNVPSPYPSEYLEILLELSGSQNTQLTFINGWDGEPLSDEFLTQARAAWSEWLDRMELALGMHMGRQGYSP